MTADLARAKDWSKTPLGALEDWPQQLFDMVNLVLSAPLPMQVYWGPNYISVYNDGLIPALAEHHPAALGCPSQGIWKEAWPIIGKQLDRICKSRLAEKYERNPIPLVRDGLVVETFWDYSYTPMFDQRGEVVGVLNVAQDVTQSVLDERALRSSRQEFLLGMESASLGMWHYDSQTGLVVADERMHRIFGSPETDGSVNYWLDMVHPEDRKRVDEHFAGALERRHLYDLEYRIIRGGEVRWLRSKGRVIGSDGQPERMFAIVEDVTERKLTEAALQRNEKLAAVGRLAASIAHEINNPLESVTNLLFLIRGSKDLSETYEYADTAERELRRVALITNQTLRFHRQSTKATPAFCYDLIADSLSMFQGRLVNNHVQVEKRKRAEHPVECLGGEIRQVLNNLIGNAIDAMPSGGRLLLRSREATDPHTGGRGLVLTVADTGSGMSVETQKRLFEAFYSTKGMNGSGLGLWISKEIVDRHHGRLRLRSRIRPGRSGTVFMLFLPFQVFSQDPLSVV